ncbi:Pro-Pol poly [Paramuricea clavata]|uniref:Pro-Pol poly n=1 Tax=Paramuricea clavata TaxID=317549 RepID=A0A7D9KFG3_PARCT|nr:Pro-Pol poly [Paramuricea clavata]
MARILEQYWVPRLRQLTRKVIKKCYDCRRFQAKAVLQPPPGMLPPDRTEGSRPFETIGVDFAGPIKYIKKRKEEGKAYILLYACSLARAVYLELMPCLDTQKFIESFKKFIARKGRPSKVYSYNAKTFVSAANWLRTAQNDEKLNEFLSKNRISWQFNLSRAPWWGGQFERLIGLVKRALHWFYIRARAGSMSHTRKGSTKACKKTSFTVKKGDVVIIQSDERSRGKWPLGVFDELYKGRDGVVRAVKRRAGKTYLERAVNHLYPLELSCDRTETKEPINLNPEAAPFRPRRDAAVTAQQRIKEVAEKNPGYRLIFRILLIT